MELVYRAGAPEALWSAGLQAVYLFHGEEDRLKEEAVAALAGRIIDPDFAEFDREVLNADGTELNYVYDPRGSQDAVAALLDDLARAGIRLKDLHTTQSSLEDIFVNLVKGK